jgi:prepilin-type N-terminal cleavage/methylation domain-containing protein
MRPDVSPRFVPESSATARLSVTRFAETYLNSAMTLIELLVVLAIIAMISGAVTFAVLRSMQNQEKKQCQTNMLMIEAAKDEYVRDHPGVGSIDESEFKNYFRFGIPKCPSGQVYLNILNPTVQVVCPKHGTITVNN